MEEKTGRLYKICKNLTEQDIIEACKKYHDELTKFKKGDSNYIIYKNEKYRLNATIRLANNNILKNPNKLLASDFNTIYNQRLFKEKFSNAKEISLKIDENDNGIHGWFPKNYTPGFSTEEWIELLNNKKIFDEDSLKIMKRMDDIGGQATCKQLAQKYGWAYSSYIGKVVGIAQRIHKYTNCPTLQEDNENAKWWPILFLGQKTSDKDEGNYYWKLREELAKAIKQVDLSKILYETGVKMTENTKPALNQILYGPPGTGKTYNTVIEAMKIIDKEVINYDKDGNVTNYDFVKTEFDKYKKEGRIEFVTFHQSYSYEEFVEGIKPVLDDTNSKDLKYELKPGIFKQICDEASKKLYKPKNNKEIEQVSFDDVINTFKEKYPDGSDCSNLKNISFNDNNEFIYHFGKQDDDRKIDLNKIKVLFEKNLKYKTAIEFNADYNGNKPLKGYNHNFYKELLVIKNELENENQKYIEINKEFEIDKNAPKYVLIIDEINRGNISKIFGELITLIEPDKRKGGKHELRVTLPYSQQPDFGVPSNLYIIGTMNTADKSLALLDVALRRRFEFVPMYPKYDLKNLYYGDFLKELNKKIYDNKTSADYLIGHSYFMDEEEKPKLENILNNKVIPLLMEYYNGKIDKVKDILKEIKTEDNIYEITFNSNYSFDGKEPYYYLQVEKVDIKPIPKKKGDESASDEEEK